MTPSATGQGPLSGMRVLDLSQQLPGPYATLLLAGLGARVTKVEPPSGDAARHLDPEMFRNVNADKESLVLDLKSASGREELHTRVRAADVFVEGFRPGVAARLGCGYETLRALRPELVYCSVSGAGQDGPLAHRPTHDLSLQAMAGALEDTVPLERIGVPWVDLATGSSVALAVTAAWQAGQAGYLDMSMLDAAASWTRVKPAALEPGPEPTYGTLLTADGTHVTVALLEDAMWQRLCTALDWTEWAADPELAAYAGRRRHGRSVRRCLEREFARRTLTQALALAAEHDLPIGPVDTSHEPATAEQLARRGGDARSHRACLPLPAVLLTELGEAPALGSADSTQP